MASAHNQVAFSRRRRAGGQPTVLEQLTDAAHGDGAPAAASVREVAERTGTPEASVHGVATFYDDLRGPRGTRHVRVCTGSACHAAGGAEALLTELSEGFGTAPGAVSADGAVSLARTVCLGFCHSSPALHDGDVIDAGEGVAERALAGRTRAAPEPAARSILAQPALIGGHEPWSGLDRALAGSTPQQLIDEVEESGLTGRGGAAFPAGRKWRFAATAPASARDGAPARAIVCNGDEGDAGSYIDKYLMEHEPALLIEGMTLAAFAVGATNGFILVRSEYPRSAPALRSAIEAAHASGRLGDDARGDGQPFTITVVEGAGSYVVGEETALLACLEGRRGQVAARPPFPAQSGIYGAPTVVHNVETLCNVPLIAARGAAAFAALSPDSPSAGSKLVCFNERFREPGVVEVPFGITVGELCEDVGGGMRAGRELVAVQIGGPLGGILPASLLDTPFDLHTLPEHGCMVGHGSVLGIDDSVNLRGYLANLLEFAAEESCGQCFPCRVGLTRAHELAAADGPIEQRKLEPLLDALERASLCAHGGGIPAPVRSLMTHFPGEVGVRG